MKSSRPSLTLIATALFAIFAAQTQASQGIAANEFAQSPLSAAVSYDMDVAEWSLKHSSVAASIDHLVLENSLVLMQRAREELLAGNARTAQELTRRAAQPLSRMGNDAMSGKHPDAGLQTEEIRLALASIIARAETIAAEKSAATDFVTLARESLDRSDTLRREGKADEAARLLEHSYAVVQQHVAQLRSGENFYIEAPKGTTAADWIDGLRRIEERRVITDYLMTEATYDGLDVAALANGVANAETTIAHAVRLAGEERWDQALRSLDLAYVQFEDSWRAIGVEW